jgi:hypothetical protein
MSTLFESDSLKQLPDCPGFRMFPIRPSVSKAFKPRSSPTSGPRTLASERFLLLRVYRCGHERLTVCALRGRGEGPDSVPQGVLSGPLLGGHRRTLWA